MLKAHILVHFEMGIIGFLQYLSQNFPCWKVIFISYEGAAGNCC